MSTKLAGFPNMTPPVPVRDAKVLGLQDITSILQGLHGFGYDPNQVIHETLPNPGVKGRIFVDPDQNRILLDSGSEWRLVVAGTGGGGGGPHNILSTTHSDTLTGSVVRGDLMVGNATPKWTRLPIGASGTVLKSNGSDPSWAVLSHTELSDIGLIPHSTIDSWLDQSVKVSSSPTFAGLAISNLSAGSVLFAGENGAISQDNTNLFWDNTNKLLNIGGNVLIGTTFAAGCKLVVRRSVPGLVFAVRNTTDSGNVFAVDNYGIVVAGEWQGTPIAGNYIADGAISTSKIIDGAVTYAKIQNVTSVRLLGRASAGAGVIEELTVSGGIEFISTGIQTSAFTGDVTKPAGGTVLTIANNAVTYAKMQDVSASPRFLGRISTGAGDPEELTPTQATSLLDIFTSTSKGLVPASGGGTTNFLRADGVWAAPPGGGGGVSLPTYLVSIPEISPWGVSGYPCLTAVASTAATTVALTASRTYWYPFVVWKAVTSITLYVNVTTASAGTHYLGVYASDENGKPTSLLGSGSFAAGTTGVKAVALIITLNPGIYWVAWAAGSAATVRGIAIAGARSFGLTSTLGTAHVTYWYTTGNTLPSTAPTSGYTAATGAIVPAISVIT